MLTNYFKIAIRSLWKRKFFSFINVISLSIGLSASFIIGMMVYHDFTFDKFHEDSDQIYRVVSESIFKGEQGGNPGVPIPLGPDLEANFPEVALKANLFMWELPRITAPLTNKVSKINDRTLFVEPTYFKIFQYDWIAGDPATALDAPNKVVLTVSRAAYFFPNLSPDEIMGQTLDYEETKATITGLVQDYKENTDLIFTEFISLPTVLQTTGKGMATQDYESVSSGSQLFIKLRKDADIDSFNERLEQVSRDSWGEFSKKYDYKTFFRLQPLADLHFDTVYGVFDDTRAQADKTVLLSLAGVALFLLLLGIINFINLNTAAATQRAKEIGVRKTLGSSRSQIVKQFLGETFVLTIISGILSLGITYLLLQIFSEFIVEEVNLGLLSEPLVLIGVVLLVVVVAVVAGFYPALILSSFKPSRVLKGERVAEGKANLRQGLTIFQFVIAQVFIIGTLTVVKQIHYMLNTDMGFSQENRMYVQMPWGVKDFSVKQTFQQQVDRITAVEMTSLGSMAPASTSAYTNMIELADGDDLIKTDIRLLHADIQYLDLYDIDLVAGRKPLNDTLIELVVNETAVRALGFENTSDILNQNAKFMDKMYPVVGVMQDFNQQSLADNIEPMMYLGDTARKQWSQFGTLHIKARPNADISNLVEDVEKAFHSIWPEKDFTLNFTDEKVAAFYKKDQQLSKLLTWATALSILISCLGLLGLVVHTTERRKKEIGIRKVVGAGVIQINALLCKDFVYLILIAFVIAAPISYYFLRDYLQDFAYRTDLSPLVFIGSVLGMVLIATGIMSIKTIAAARQNPVDSLKTE
ncbi:MAG: FtsX-like permease family protein [Nonlabens sp.]